MKREGFRQMKRKFLILTPLCEAQIESRLEIENKTHHQGNGRLVPVTYCYRDSEKYQKKERKQLRIIDIKYLVTYSAFNLFIFHKCFFLQICSFVFTQTSTSKEEKEIGEVSSTIPFAAAIHGEKPKASIFIYGDYKSIIFMDQITSVMSRPTVEKLSIVDNLDTYLLVTCDQRPKLFPTRLKK
ncbi:CLUMA_CG000511, isoform A [Clunio marinus]|uniref:CLUMA_CG000511, isoform A n=1 Tax=Clunio marinus TaxID=568069 RepID=A0A1J1HJM9_9DIPT|nr:CLUMA_CG000511, isoform A [Clunio marinus]